MKTKKRCLAGLVIAGVLILICGGCGNEKNSGTKIGADPYLQSDESGQNTSTAWEGAVLYEDQINWEVTQRAAEYEFEQKTELPDLFSVALTLSFPGVTDEENGHNTLFLLADGQKIAGLQNTADDRITVWTKWRGSDSGKASEDKGAFEESGVLVDHYDKGSMEVVFTVNRSTRRLIASCGDVNIVLSFDENLDWKDLRGFSFGNFSREPSVNVEKVVIKEADPDYMVISGQKNFARVSGSVVEKTYLPVCLKETEGEMIRWKVAKSSETDTTEKESAALEGISIADGVLKVSDLAVPGRYLITAASSANEKKRAFFEVEIGDFQKISVENAVIDGPAVLEKGKTGRFVIQKLTDGYGDDVTDLLPAAKWSSGAELTAKISDSNPGAGEVMGVSDGKATITAVIDNGGVKSEFSFEMIVGSHFFAEGNACGDETKVDVSDVVITGEICGWQITTAKDGDLVNREFVRETPTMIDTRGADRYEIAPVYCCEGTLENLGEGGYQFDLAEGMYNFVITNITGSRRDVYVNDQMLVNNFLQDGGKPNSIQVDDIFVEGGKAIVSLEDCSGKMSTKIEVYKSPSIVKRTRKIYVLGDSLVCRYYNGADASNNKKTGFGQVLQDYIKDAEVVDLGNSGQTAEGLIGTAFTQVKSSAREGDIVLFEAGYNDRNYSTEENMKAALREAVEVCERIGAKLIFVSPNASPHDYKDTVSWTTYMEDVVKETGTDYIDLGELSYQFLHDTYGEDSDVIAKNYVVSDKLHSTYYGANKWASIIAGKLADLGYGELVDFEYRFTFRDAQKNDIICQAERGLESALWEGSGAETDASSQNPDDNYAFYFGSGKAPDKFTKIEGQEFSEEKGYGFRASRALAVSEEGITCERNFSFRLAVPNGNFIVTVDTTSETVVSENVDSVTAQTGIEKTGKEFDVAVCDGILDLTFPANTYVKSVQIVPGDERTKRDKPYIFAIGDSTTKNTADGAKSWGNVAADGEVELPAIFGGFENHGMAGRDSVNYYNQGRLEAVLLAVCPGDYVTVNMGINSKETGEQKAYYTLMKDYYVQGLLQRGAIPVIVTATPDGPVGGNLSADYDASTGKFKNNRGDGARNNVLRRIAGELDLNLIELGQWGEDWMNSLTMEDVETYNKAHGTSFTTVLEMVQSFYVDHNHYKQYLGIQIAKYLFGELEKIAGGAR